MSQPAPAGYNYGQPQAGHGANGQGGQQGQYGAYGQQQNQAAPYGQEETKLKQGGQQTAAAEGQTGADASKGSELTPADADALKGSEPTPAGAGAPKGPELTPTDADAPKGLEPTPADAGAPKGFESTPAGAEAIAGAGAGASMEPIKQTDSMAAPARTAASNHAHSRFHQDPNYRSTMQAFHKIASHGMTPAHVESFVHIGTFALSILAKNYGMTAGYEPEEE